MVKSSGLADRVEHYLFVILVPEISSGLDHLRGLKKTGSIKSGLNMGITKAMISSGMTVD